MPNGEKKKWWELTPTELQQEVNRERQAKGLAPLFPEPTPKEPTLEKVIDQTVADDELLKPYLYPTGALRWAEKEYPQRLEQELQRQKTIGFLAQAPEEGKELSLLERFTPSLETAKRKIKTEVVPLLESLPYPGSKFWELTPAQKEKYTAAGFGLKQPLPQETAMPIYLAAISGQPIENYPAEWQPEIRRLREGFTEPTPAKEFTYQWAMPTALGGMGAAGFIPEVTAAKAAAQAIKQPVLRGLAKAGVKAAEILVAPAEKAKVPPEVSRIITQAKEVVRQDKPGWITNLLQKIPGIKQAMQFERPGLKMAGKNEKLLVGHVGETAARSDVAARAMGSRLPLLNEIETNFGKDALHGGKTNVRFLGTIEQARNPITGTLKDIADNPELYALNDAQKTLLANMEIRNTGLLNHIVNNYGGEVGLYKAKPGGAFLPNVDISEDIIQKLGSETKAVATGRGRTRIWQTARERMAYDKAFKPEVDARKLLEGMDNFKASIAGGQTFKEAVGGMTRLEVMEKTHLNLFKKMTGLRKQLQSLRGSAGTINTNIRDGIDTFLSSPIEGTDLSVLRDSLDVKLKSGIRKGMDIRAIQAEIDTVRAQLKTLKPAWEAANLKGYTFVQEGIYRYFPDDTAKLLVELRGVSNNPILNFMDNIRATAFSGDLSPVLGVQTPMGILADPAGSFMAGKGGLGKVITDRNLLRPFQLDALADDIAQAPNEWAQFFSLMGRAPAGTPREFASGWLGKIPGVNKFTEGTYILVTRQTKALYDRTWQLLVKDGIPELQAKVTASKVASEIFPLVSPTRLGQSQARAALLRALPTSYSFIRQPATMIARAFSGYVKIGLKRTLTPAEKQSVKLMTTMAASILTTSATSAAISAAIMGQDVRRAVWDAVNPDPSNGKFASIIIGNHRIPLGGPYRAIFRAIFPQKFAGSPFPIPFGGAINYVGNRLNPALRVTTDLLQNKDYYRHGIVKGPFPENLLRGVAYMVEGALPLTAGAGIEAVRTGSGDIGWQMAGQFAGVSPIELNPVIQAALPHIKDIPQEMIMPDQQGRKLRYEDLNDEQKTWLFQTFSDYKQAVEEKRKRTGTDEQIADAKTRANLDAKYNADLSELAKGVLVSHQTTIAQYIPQAERFRIERGGQAQYREEYQKWAPGSNWAETQKWLEENTKPEDKAYDKYMELRGNPPKVGGVPDWDKWNSQLTAYFDSLSPEVQAYIERRRIQWINNLPPEAQAIERLLKECETIYDEYYAVAPKGRVNWRTFRPEVDAKLYMSDRGTTLQTPEAAALVEELQKKYNIPATALPEVGGEVARAKHMKRVPPSTIEAPLYEGNWWELSPEELYKQVYKGEPLPSAPKWPWLVPK